MNRRKTRDDGLHPDRKYRGILYTPRRRTDLDDLPASHRRSSQSPLFIEKITEFFGRFKKKEAPARGGRAAGSARRAASAISQSTGSFTPLRGSMAGRGRGGAQAASGNIFADKLVKMTLLICGAVCIVSAVAITTSFAKPTASVTLIDDGREIKADTAAGTVEEFLDVNGVTLGPADELENSLDAPIEEGMSIIIWRSKAITVVSGDAEIQVDMIAGTVADALDRAGVTPSPDDEVYPSLDSYVRPQMRIEHLIVETRERVDTYEIPYEETTKEDSSLAQGDTEIARWGENGELAITTKETYKNGVLVAEQEIAEEVTKEPITQVVSVGTYVPPPPKQKVKISDVHSGGGSSSSGSSSGSGSGSSGSGSGSSSGGGKYVRTMKVTAYCSACDSAGGKTASGTYASWGTVANNDFPIGTLLDIPGYGIGRVEDRMGSSGVIDVYLGQRDVCTCSTDWSTGSREITVLE